MSGFQTHALIGAVSGLALVRAAEATRPDLLPERISALGPILGIPGGVGGAIVIVASALLALVPDIDEPKSYVAQRVREVLTLVGLVLGAALGYGAHGPAWLILAGGGGGAILGLGAGWGLLKGIRAAAGGHRRLTHSLVSAGALAALAGLLAWGGVGQLWLVPAALAWGIVTHDLADVVTPSGVPLFYPLADAKVRVLPEPLCRSGEPLIALAALAVGWWLVSL